MVERPLPDDERLCRLINEAYEYLPGPDMSRLSRLQERLIRRAPGRRTRYRPRRLPWWIALLLVSGAAVAAWWAGILSFPEHAFQPAPRQVAPPAPPRGQEKTRRQEPPSSEHYKEDSPVIYQREDFPQR